MSPGARLQDLTAKYMQNPRRFFVPLANEYRQAGELDRAIALCREHLPAQPGHMSGHIVLGRAYFEKGDTAAAREVFLTSVALDDENVIALRHLGDIARLRNEIAEARQWYARVLDADPQNAEIERLLRSLNETARAAGPASGGPSMAPPALETVRPPVSPSTSAQEPWERPVASVGPTSVEPATLEPWERGPAAAPPVPAPSAAAIPVPATPAAPPPSPWESLIDALPEELPSAAPVPVDRRPASRPAPTPVTPVPTTARATPMHQLPPSDFDLADAATALSEPTPPGLRAIMEGSVEPARRPEPATPDITAAALPPLELSADLPFLAEPDVPAVPGVEEALPALPPMAAHGDGFSYDDLDALSEAPADATVPTTPSLPPMPPPQPQPAASMTPPDAPAILLPDVLEEDVAPRPAFGGALASFAAWRSARARETPVSTPPIVEAPPVAAAAPVMPVPAPTPAPSPALADDEPAEVVDAAALPAGEFETETMAQLYAQQGFTDQALNVYKALARRTPTDLAIQARIEELESLSATADPETSLQADADKALSFGEFTVGGELDSSTPSMLEAMYELSPPPVPVAEASASDGATWVDAPAPDAGEDDWFAEEHETLGSDGFSGGDDALFGIPATGFASAATIPSPRDAWSPAGPGGSAGGPTLATIFHGLEIAGADAAASTLLVDLAGQMVGRLPKDAPTLPVPDVLELPVPASGDGAGSAKAPLLSFDRFFSGSGSPPRARIDTPPPTPRQTGSVPVVPPPVKQAPSLSPTFGGLPVIPPPPAAATVPWATFEPTAPGAAAAPDRPSAMPPSVAAAPTGGEAEPVPVVYITSRHTPESAPPATEPPQPAADGAVAHDAPAQDPGAEAPRTPPSDFHRWLEGLS